MLEFALDKIQALLDEGKITEEAANSMAESFVNQYMTEGNAYNKAIKKYDDENKKSDDKVRELHNLQGKFLNSGNGKMMKFIDGKIKDEIGKKEGLSKKLGLYSRKYIDTDDNQLLDYVKHKATIGDPDSPSFSRNLKQSWMRDHGDKGMRPEERYKENRYLDVQKAMRESFDEMQLGLYEAADAGLLDPDFIPVMIEAVEFYLES